MGLYPPTQAELWHVRRVPGKYLENGMASIVPMVDAPRDSYTAPVDAYIDDDGYLRVSREDGPDQYLPMEDVRLQEDGDES